MVRRDSQGVERLMHLHSYVIIAVSQGHTLRTWCVHLRMGYLMLTLQREARSLAAAPRPQVVQKAEGQGLKLVLSEQEHQVVVGMSQVIGHVSIALMQTPPQLLPALSAAIVDLEALYVFQSTRFVPSAPFLLCTIDLSTKLILLHSGQAPRWCRTLDFSLLECLHQSQSLRVDCFLSFINRPKLYPLRGCLEVLDNQVLWLSSGRTLEVSPCCLFPTGLNQNVAILRESLT